METRGLSKSLMLGAKTQTSGGKKGANETSEAKLVQVTEFVPTSVNPEYEQVKTEDNLDEVTKKTLKKKKLKAKADQKLPQVRIRPPDETTKSMLMRDAEALKKSDFKSVPTNPEKPAEVPDLGSLFLGMKLGAINNKGPKGNKISP